MSKSFTENFVHGGEAILSGKWPFWALILPSSDEKTRRRRPKFAHLTCFCARFLLKFCYFSRFCKHAKISKVNAKFSKGVDFFFSTNANFYKKSTQITDNQPFTELSQNSRFFVQKFFRGEFLKYGGQKRPFCQFCSKKRAMQIGVTRWVSITRSPTPPLPLSRTELDHPQPFPHMGGEKTMRK